MQSPAPTGAAGAAPAIALSPVERTAFAHLFNLADPERTGIVTGDAAVSFFAKSKLPPSVLGQIWAMADSANNGFLTPPSFSIALRLIAHAQRGETITEASIKRPGPPPTMEGVNLPLTAQLTGSQSGTLVPTNMPGVIEIKPEDRARYTRIFANSGPVGGLIDGDRAKEIFVKSKLPFDKLGAIWNLADTQARGSLDLTDFIIAMHFIQNTMNGTLNSIPAALPPGLYEQAKGPAGAGSRFIPGSPLAAQNTGGSTSGFGSSGIPRQMTGSSFPAQSAFQSPRHAVSAPAAAWDVTPDEKARADQFFDGLDVSRQGRLDGAAVVPFFMQSKLTESVLAHVWDLSDVTQSGTLSKDEFAVAMHLINSQLAGKPLPQQLPSSLVPPSMRNMDLPTAVNPQQTDTQKDLFSLMDDDPPAPTISASSAFITPSPAAPVVATQQSTPFAASSTAPTERSAPGPFDDDFFGGGNSSASPLAAQPAQSVATALSPAATGGSFGTATAFRPPGFASPGGPASPSASTSRLGSAFTVAAPATSAGAAVATAFGSSDGTDQSVEFGNKSNQLRSTEKAVLDLQSKRSTLESSIANDASTIADLESRLATVRAQHETETKLVKDLEERQQKQSVELKELRENVIRDESELSALKAEKDELEQALMRDREDVRDMKKRMNDVQAETKSLKEQLEKLRKDARQQKGLVAISKKQLATAEAEQDKVADEIEAVQRGDLGAEEAEHHDVTSAGAAGADAAIPATRSAAAEPVTSPAASVRSYNPFDRFGAGAGASSSQPETSSVSTSLLAGAGAGAALGGIAAAAAHHEDDSHTSNQSTEARGDASAQPLSLEADPFGVQQAEVQPHVGGSSLGFDDAFAVPGEPSGATTSAAPEHAQVESTGFDDNFGNDFVASTPAVPGFTASESATAATAADVEATTDNHHASGLAAAGGLGAGASVLGAAAIHAGEPLHKYEAAQELESISDTAGPFAGDLGTADRNHPDQPDADEDEDSSDDDDEGPEEVGGFKARGYDTPVEGAADRFPEVDASGERLSSSTVAPPTRAEHQHTVPGGLEDVTTATVSAESAPVDPTSIGDIGGRTASTTSIAPVSRQGTISDDINESLTTSELTRSKDAESSPHGAGTAAAGAIGIAALAAGTGALTLGERGQGDTTPSATTPADDNVPLSQLVGLHGAKLAPPTAAADSTTPAEPAASPTLSPKTRRAPPPAPVRSATNLSTSSGAPAAAAATVLADEPTPIAGSAAPVTVGGDSSKSTNPFGMDEFSAAPSLPDAGQHKNDNGSGSNFDDFDSAFEDLGPSEAVPSSSAAGPVGMTAASDPAGFDDAFDNDFDFVPSFSAVGASAIPSGDTASREVPSSGGAGAGSNNTFDDFDAAFDSTPAVTRDSSAKNTSTTADASVIPAVSVGGGLGAVAGSGSHADRGTASNATSGFSFEDTFDPADGSSTTSAGAAPSTLNAPIAASTSTAAASTTLPSSVSSPIAPPGTYAPPPGPPPGFNAPPALPSRSSTRHTTGGGGGAIAEAEDYTGALPDDAAQVKQLCGMGFTREKVIQALEKSNYRTEKALERLLASA